MFRCTRWSRWMVQAMWEWQWWEMKYWCVSVTIKVLSRCVTEETSSSWFVYKEIGTLFRISTDIHSNIYATDNEKHMVRVFSKDGAFFLSFGCDDNWVKITKNPLGICVSGQFVYVTDYGGHYVSVFTTQVIMSLHLVSKNECLAKVCWYLGTIFPT